MSLAAAIRKTFPNAVLQPGMGNVMLVDYQDGKGIQIARWDVETIGAAKPSPTDLVTLERQYVQPPDDSTSRLKDMLSIHGLDVNDLKRELGLI